MGLFSWLKREPKPTASAPSVEFPTAYDAIVSLIVIDLERGDCDEWITFHAANGSRGAMIQTCQRVINLLKHEIDLPLFLVRCGEQELAQRARMGGRKGNDPTHWEVENGTADEVARVVDLLLEREFKLGSGYSVEGDLGT